MIFTGIGKLVRAKSTGTPVRKQSQGQKGFFNTTITLANTSISVKEKFLIANYRIFGQQERCYHKKENLY